MRDTEAESRIKELTSQFLSGSERDYIGFWQIVPQVRQIFSSYSEQEQRESAIEIARRLITMGLVPFNFKKNCDGSFSIVIWENRDPESAGVRIANEWKALRTDPSPADICWFKTPS